MITSHVPTELMDKYLPAIEPLISKALDRNNGEMDWGDVSTLLRCGQYKLFITYNTHSIIQATIVKVVEHPKYNALSIILMGGSDIHKWGKSFHEVMVKYAKHYDCRTIEFTGRKGWIKLMSQFGYKEGNVKLVKEL